MTWVSITDAWITELSTNVAGLATAELHRYAPWSLEALFADVDERHLAVWPQAEPEVTVGLTTTPADLATQSFAALVWEDASAESSRRFDDDTANAAWLALHEAIRARFYLTANLRLGDANIMDTRYKGVAFEMAGTTRSMALRFEVRIPLTYS